MRIGLDLRPRFTLHGDDVGASPPACDAVSENQRQPATPRQDCDPLHQPVPIMELTGTARQAQRAFRRCFDEIEDLADIRILGDLFGLNIDQPFGQRAFV